MDKRALTITLLSLLVLFASFAYSFFTPIQTIYFQVPITIITLTYILCGVTFFGYLTFVPSLFLGLELGAEKNVAILLYLIPITIATYSASKLGFLLKDDFVKKTNFTPKLKRIIKLFIISIILSIIIEIALGLITQIWPEGFFGLNIAKSGQTIEIIKSIFS